MNHIAIDFEGVGRVRGQPQPHPSLLGALVPRPDGTGRGAYHVWLLERELYPIANPVRLPGRRHKSSLGQAVAELIALAEERDCKLGAYSQHELTVIETHLAHNSQLIDSFQSRFWNVKRAAERLRNWRGIATEDNTLNSLLGALVPGHRFPPPPSCGVAVACRRLREAGERNRRWGSWSAEDKTLAHELLDYNRGDCRAVWKLANRVIWHLGPPKDQ